MHGSRLTVHLALTKTHLQTPRDETEEDNLSYLKGWIEEDLVAKEMEEGVTKLPQEFLPPEVDELVNENEILSRQTDDGTISSEDNRNH